jgi:hypothetical protein
MVIYVFVYNPFHYFSDTANQLINEIFVTISVIVDILKIIDPYKASGPDKISHKMLKISPEKIVVSLI